MSHKTHNRKFALDLLVSGHSECRVRTALTHPSRSRQFLSKRTWGQVSMITKDMSHVDTP